MRAPVPPGEHHLAAPVHRVIVRAGEDQHLGVRPAGAALDREVRLGDPAGVEELDQRLGVPVQRLELGSDDVVAEEIAPATAYLRPVQLEEPDDDRRGFGAAEDAVDRRALARGVQGIEDGDVPPVHAPDERGARRVDLRVLHEEIHPLQHVHQSRAIDEPAVEDRAEHGGQPWIVGGELPGEAVGVDAERRVDARHDGAPRKGTRHAVAVTRDVLMQEQSSPRRAVEHDATVLAHRFPAHQVYIAHELASREEPGRLQPVDRSIGIQRGGPGGAGLPAGDDADHVASVAPDASGDPLHTSGRHEELLRVRDDDQSRFLGIERRGEFVVERETSRRGIVVIQRSVDVSMRLVGRRTLRVHRVRRRYPRARRHDGDEQRRDDRHETPHACSSLPVLPGRG